MGNVASWSGTKTLDYFEDYDQASIDYQFQGRAKIISKVPINLQTMANGSEMNGPTTGRPFQNIENEGFLRNNSGKAIFSPLKSDEMYCFGRSEFSIFKEG